MSRTPKSRKLALQSAAPIPPIVLTRSETVTLGVDQEEFKKLIDDFVEERYMSVPEGKVRKISIGMPQGPGEPVTLTITDSDKPAEQETKQ